jgi:integrase
MPKRRSVQARLYPRHRSDGPPRWWGDFREFADVGGKREPLILAGETRATTDEAQAHELFARRLQELQEAQANAAPAPPLRARPTLGQAVAEYLELRERESTVTPAWVAAARGFLGRAVAFFGADRRLASLTAEDLVAWVEHLRSITSAHHRPLSAGSIRHHLNALSGLFRRAQRKSWVPRGINPVALLEPDERPRAGRSRTEFLEVPDAARVLWAAATYPARKHEPEMRLAHALLATFLYTGGRAKEVTGLAISDVDFGAELVRFQPHPWHVGQRLKTEGSERVVPLWPHLREVLERYLEEYRLDRAAGADLLFPSPHGNGSQPLTDLRDLLDRVLVRAGFLKPVLDEEGNALRDAKGRRRWEGRRIRTRTFRTTYCAARLQTLDRGAPVSPETVAAEFGHGSSELVQRVYKRIGRIRHRSEVVEFRWQSWWEERGGALVLPEGSGRSIRNPIGTIDRHQSGS